MPDDLQKVALAPAENVEIAGVRVALQRLLHQNRKGAKSFSHIRMARRQPDPNPGRYRDHRRQSALMTRASAAASTSAPTVIRSPALSRISIRPISSEPPSPGVGAGSFVTVTGTAYDVAYMDADTDADNTVY